MRLNLAHQERGGDEQTEDGIRAQDTRGPTCGRIVGIGPHERWELLTSR